MPRGGSRPGAGRKHNPEIKTIRTVMDKTVPQSEWKTIIRNLLALAQQGSVRAAHLLFTYRFGNPYTEQPSDTDLEQIRFIDIRRGDPDVAWESVYDPDTGTRIEVPVDPITLERLPLPQRE